MRYRVDVREYEDGEKMYIPKRQGIFGLGWRSFWDQSNWRDYSFASLEEAEHFIRVEFHRTLAKTVRQESVARYLNRLDLVSENPVRAQIRHLLESMDGPSVVHYLRETSGRYFIYEKVPLVSGEASKLFRQNYELDSHWRVRLIGEPNMVTVSQEIEIIVYHAK